MSPVDSSVRVSPVDSSVRVSPVDSSVRVSPVNSSVDEIIKSGNCLVMNSGNIENVKMEVKGSLRYSGKVKISFSVGQI